jgi:hypothetical protein
VKRELSTQGIVHVEGICREFRVGKLPSEPCTHFAFIIRHRLLPGFLAVANSVGVVAVFAGGLTFSNVITLQTTCPATCKVVDRSGIANMLSIAFIFFIIALYSSVLVQTVLRPYKPTDRIFKSGAAYYWLLYSFYCAIYTLQCRFCFLFIALKISGYITISIIGFACVVLIALCILLIIKLKPDRKRVKSETPLYAQELN